MTGSNNPVPDELAAVREQIKQLEVREQELRLMLIANPDLRSGANWLADVVITKQNRTDLKEMRAMYPDIVEQFTLPVSLTRVVLSGVTEDGEIVSARKMRKDK